MFLANENDRIGEQVRPGGDNVVKHRLTIGSERPRQPTMVKGFASATAIEESRRVTAVKRKRFERRLRIAAFNCPIHPFDER
jgi:hypothetical protein